MYVAQDHETRDEDKEAHVRPNWPLLILVTSMPLQNIYLGHIPKLGPGLNYLNIMVALAFLVWKFREDLSPPTRTCMKGPMYTYVAIFVLSAIVGMVKLGPLGEGIPEALKDMMTPLLLYFIVLNSVRDRKGVIMMITATLIPLPYIFRVFNAQLSSLASWHYSDNLRLVHGTFMLLGSNEMAAFFAGYSLVLLALVWYIKKPKIRMVLAALLILELYCLLYGYSRGAWLSFLGGFAMMGIYLNKKITITSILLVLLLQGPVLSLLPVSVQERFGTIEVEKGQERDNSAESRFVLWGIAMEDYKHSPIFGIGYRVFQNTNRLAKDTHNYYVKMLTEQGIIGLLVFLTILWRVFRMSRELANKAGDDPLYRALGVGMIGCVVAFFIGNMFGDRFSHYPMITYFWVYAALVQRSLYLAQGGDPDPDEEYAVYARTQ